MRLALVAAILLCAGVAHADTQPVTATAGPSANTSTTITTGKTFQTIAIASFTRRFLSFQNVCNKAGNCVSTADLCYLFMADSGTPTLSNSLIVSPGQEYLRSVGGIPQGPILATCDSSGDNFHLEISQ